MLGDIIDALSFSFPFPLSLSSIVSLSSIDQFHYYKHVLHLSLYMAMLVFVYMFILDLSSVYERKHVVFVFLILAYFIKCDILQLCPLNFNPHVLIPYGLVILHCVCIYIYVYIPQFLDPFIGCRVVSKAWLL
jgi:hypothetical protein